MEIKELISKMTLEEKAGLCSGEDFWHTKAIERLGIPSMMVSDGPHGLRKQNQEGDHLGIHESIEAVCFPAGCTVASSFDRDLLYELGEAVGRECQAEHVGVILGPAVNIKRSPLCGRNFEYYSEDPYLTAELATGQIKGVQSQSVGACVKHFFANNQEYRRMSSDSCMDERTAREIYLSAFERIVSQAKPWTVMCSYNKINGVYAAENKKYLTDVLRGEWGFDGFVVSDWHAVTERVADLKAGMDLEMPGSNGVNDQRIVHAVQNGLLEETILDQAVERILSAVFRFAKNRDQNAVFDKEADHLLAGRAAAESAVLLKNEGILPLEKTEKVLFVGEFARKPRYQGGGSSYIHSWKVESAMEMANEFDVIYAEGYSTENDEMDEILLTEAVEKAEKVEKVVIFAGLPDAFESEGYDRTHMHLPYNQNRLIEELSKVNDHVVVVLHNGSPVEMPWIDKVKGVLEVYLGGQAVGRATVELLYGKVNPSGHLAETFPLKLRDNPSSLYYLGEGDRVEYREGVFVGYRYYDAKEMEVLFPFGHGLSYTTFEYSNMRLNRTWMEPTDTVFISVDVTNTGVRFGKEVVQLYIMPPKGTVIRPVKELKGFEKIALNPGETKTVVFSLNIRDFSYFDCERNGWNTENGIYRIVLGQSSRNLLVEKEIEIKHADAREPKLTMDTTVGDLLAIPGADKIMNTYPAIAALFNVHTSDAMGKSTAGLMEAMLRNMPVHALPSFCGGTIPLEEAEELLEKIKDLIQKH